MLLHNQINQYKRDKAKLHDGRKFKDLDASEKEESKAFNKAIKANKQGLYDSFKVNKTVRNINPDSLNKYRVISVFDSTLTRTLGMQENNLYEDLIIVQTFYFDIVEDIVTNGFYNKGEKYVCLTASAGQIRTKKTVFIKESLFVKHQKTLMCGLTVDKINALGGVNVNKYLAYLALCNSATDIWEEFDITKSIVVDDMETLVNGVVDYIDDELYTITRKKMDVPITHTDGCGMVLPRLSRKNLMVRLPWIKGLLSPFPYDKFIRLANRNNPEKKHGVICDIYGKEHDILKEDIQIIFTKSQFKMYKFYESWQDYVNNYQEFNCSAGKCNEEEDIFGYAKFNYQMLQTLTDITDDELTHICKISNDKISKLATDRKTMLKVFGVVDSNTNKTHLQKSLEIYPELLSDVYTKEILKQIKKSLVKDARSARLDIYGKYTFIIPDLYAFCEYLFLGDENPKGLLENGDVYCKLFKKKPKLDCLRSPHLYREHAVRNNVIDSTKGEWFKTNGIYTSCHDLISKMLQFDCDGDKSLVCGDDVIIEIAERNMKDIVPLYYNMRKSEATLVDNQKIYQGLKEAYTGGNIGQISNDISKIWNSEEIDLNIIKLLCMENNFTIDYAKTLYKPKRPEKIKRDIVNHTNIRVPHFFKYAKNKNNNQVEAINQSVVNRLEKLIPNKKLSFSANNVGRFNYKLLMNNPNVEIDDEVIKKYIEYNTKNHFAMNKRDKSFNNFEILYQEIKCEILKINPDVVLVTDMLIKNFYDIKKSKHKDTLWTCFGDIIYENLKRNIEDGYILCDKCGKRVIKFSNSQKLCDNCNKHTPMVNKILICVDCGCKFEVNSKNTKSIRCKKCQQEYDRKRKRIWKQKQINK